LERDDPGPSCPPQSPTRSVEVSGSQTDPLTPWYNGRAGIIPFQYSPGLLEGIFQFNPWRDYSIGIQPGGDIGASSIERRVMSGLAGGKGATPRLLIGGVFLGDTNAGSRFWRYKNERGARSFSSSRVDVVFVVVGVERKSFTQLVNKIFFIRLKTQEFFKRSKTYLFVDTIT
jgi:hypothetical protein